MIAVHIQERGQPARTVEYPGEAWRYAAELLVSLQRGLGHRSWIRL